MNARSPADKRAEALRLLRDGLLSWSRIAGKVGLPLAAVADLARSMERDKHAAWREQVHAELDAYFAERRRRA